MPAPAFEDLIDRHATAPTDERVGIEDAIFSKIIDHRNDVKRGKVSDEEQARMVGKIKTYTERVKAGN